MVEPGVMSRRSWRHDNGLTFHHVVPNVIVQGGSPGANDFSRVPRLTLVDRLLDGSKIVGISVK